MYLLAHFFITREQLAFLFYWYLTATVAESFLCRQLLASECFAESNIIFNCQTRDASHEQFESWHDDLLTPRTLDNEVSGWFNMWSRQSDRVDLPDTLMKSLVSTDPDSFPNIRILLVFECTLRIVSVLRLIKTHLRSWMADTRFYAWTLMKIYYSKHIESK